MITRIRLLTLNDKSVESELRPHTAITQKNVHVSQPMPASYKVSIARISERFHRHHLIWFGPTGPRGSFIPCSFVQQGDLLTLFIYTHKGGDRTHDLPLYKKSHTHHVPQAYVVLCQKLTQEKQFDAFQLTLTTNCSSWEITEIIYRIFTKL